MATRIVLVSLLLSLLVACDKKEDDINPGKDYTGTLALEYSRSFPTFTANYVINVNITREGEVVFFSPGQVNFSGESEKMVEGDRIKIMEDGAIQVNSLEGKWIEHDGKSWLQVNLDCEITGLQKVWLWKDYYWNLQSEENFNRPSPVTCPMEFRIENALLCEAVCGANCNDCWGKNGFRWRLQLHEAP